MEVLFSPSVAMVGCSQDFLRGGGGGGGGHTVSHPGYLHASLQVPVVQRMDNTIHQINRYPVDK